MLAGGEHPVDIGDLQARIAHGVVNGFGVQRELALAGQRADFVAFVHAHDADGIGELTQARDIHHEAPLGVVRTPPGVFAGWNIGRLISSVSFSNTTSTGMSHRRAWGDGSTFTRLVSRRGPSSSSTIARTTGVFTLNARFRIWCAISNE